MAILVFSLYTNHDDRPMCSNTMKFTLSLPPPLYNCITIDMLFNIVGHKIDVNYESWKYMWQKRPGTIFPQIGGRLSRTLMQDGFFGAVQITQILFSYFVFSLQKTVNTLIEDTFKYNAIIWRLC